MILKAILWALLVYFIYKIIFDFVIPVFKVSRKMHQQVKEFQNRVQQQKAPSQPAPPAPPEKAGEYIEFEEVKNR